MIVVETDRIYAAYTRTNRRVRWTYAEYCGRWETPEKAIDKAKEFMGDVPFEYLIEDITSTDTVSTGFVNWDRKSRTERKNAMKTFYGVFQSYDDRGKVKAHIFTVEAEKKPESTFESTKKADIYNDYFDSKAAAQEYLEGALNA